MADNVAVFVTGSGKSATGLASVKQLRENFGAWVRKAPIEEIVKTFPAKLRGSLTTVDLLGNPAKFPRIPDRWSTRDDVENFKERVRSWFVFYTAQLQKPENNQALRTLDAELTARGYNSKTIKQSLSSMVGISTRGRPRKGDRFNTTNATAASNATTPSDETMAAADGGAEVVFNFEGSLPKPEPPPTPAPVAPLVEDGQNGGQTHVHDQPQGEQDATTTGVANTAQPVVNQEPDRNTVGGAFDAQNQQNNELRDIARSLDPTLPENYQVGPNTKAVIVNRLQDLYDASSAEAIKALVLKDDQSGAVQNQLGQNPDTYKNTVGALITAAKTLTGNAFNAVVGAASSALNALAPIPEEPGDESAFVNQLFLIGVQTLLSSWGGETGQKFATELIVGKALEDGQISMEGLMLVEPDTQDKAVLAYVFDKARRDKQSPFEAVTDLTRIETEILRYNYNRSAERDKQFNIRRRPLTDAEIYQEARRKVREMLAQMPQWEETFFKHPRASEDLPPDEMGRPQARGEIRPTTTVTDPVTGHKVLYDKPQRGLNLDESQFAQSYEIRPFLPIAGGDEVLEDDNEIHLKKLQFALYDWRPAFLPGMAPDENPLAAKNEAEQALRWAGANVMPPLDANGGDLNRGVFPYGQPGGGHLPPLQVLEDQARAATLRQGIAGRMVNPVSMQALYPDTFAAQMGLASADPAWQEESQKTQGTMPMLDDDQFEMDRDQPQQDTFMADIAPAQAETVPTQLGQDIRPRSLVPLFFHKDPTSRYNPFMNQYQ